MKKIIRFVGVCLLLSAMCLSTPYLTEAADQAESDKKPSPEEMRQMMDATFGAMVPMMAKMTEAMIQTSLREGEKPETAAKLAVFKKNLYDALIKQGFSKEEAFQIVLSTAIPSASPSMK